MKIRSNTNTIWLLYVDSQDALKVAEYMKYTREFKFKGWFNQTFDFSEIYEALLGRLMHEEVVDLMCFADNRAKNTFDKNFKWILFTQNTIKYTIMENPLYEKFNCSFPSIQELLHKINAANKEEIKL